MDYLDLIINFFNITDNSGLVRKNFDRFRDSSEYKGQRIISFINFTLLILSYIAIIFGIIYIIYYFLK